jgi:hypothetical protein
MNDNALTKKSTIIIKETYCGKIPQSMGFKKTDGVIQDKEKYYKQLQKQGFIVERTKYGVFITNPKNF